MTKTNRLGLSNCDDVLPIYVGDDRTDEDAFKVRYINHDNIDFLQSSLRVKKY